MNDSSDIAYINRLYLLKARELAQIGDESRAVYLLGIPSEALRLIRKMPLPAIEALAESGVLMFGLRTTLTTLRSFAAETADGSPPSVLMRLQYLASHKTEIAGRDKHVKHHA